MKTKKKEKSSEKNENSGRAFKLGAICLIFMVIGYQAALFVNRAAVIGISARRDSPDTDYVLRGILLGTMAVIGVLVLIFLLDNRPKSPEDIMQAANIPTLAVIPSHPELSGDREHRRRRARS